MDELLSYLDSGVAFLDPATEESRKRDLQDVDKELAQHLNQVQPDSDRLLPQVCKYNAKHIPAKLSRIFAEQKQTSADDWRVIYRQGSACIRWIDDAKRKERIARRSKEIKHNWKWEFLHSPRKTRAESQVAASPRNSPRRALRPEPNNLKLSSIRERLRVPRAPDRGKRRSVSRLKHVRLCSLIESR